MKLLLKIYITALLIFFCSNLIAQKGNSNYYQNIQANSNLISKKTGIAFRLDDDNTLLYYNRLDSLFNYYNTTYNRNYHFSVSLNFADSYYVGPTLVSFDDQAYLDAVKQWQLDGNEIMDHTPNHRTNFFITKFDSLHYVEGDTLKPGIDHIEKYSSNQYKVCLEFLPTDTTNYLSTGTCNIIGDTLYGSFNSIKYDTDIYLYFPTLNKMVYIDSLLQNKQLITFQDVWGDSLNLDTLNNVKYYNLGRDHKLTINAIKILAQETLDLANQYGISRPYTWIQPGGRHPILSMAELSEALVPLGYIAGASFGEVQSFKVFNEYDPSDLKKFGMQWEDFNEDKTSWDLTKIKTVIANGIAKHKVMIGHNHFYTLGTSDFDTPSVYFEKMDSILAWCNQNNIDVKTYSEWADILYNQTPDPYENVFPPLNVNLDDSTNIYNPNGVPDGYEERTTWIHDGNIIDDKGVWEVDTTAPDGYCYTKYYKNWARIFMVKNLGGIEKGDNNFEIYTKGGVNDIIRVNISDANASSYSVISTFTLMANTPTWQKQIYTVNIPVNISEISVEVVANYFNPLDSLIKVSGMALYKKTPTISANLKILLEGPYSNGVMSTDLTFTDSIPANQPFSVSPWNYNGLESFTTLPNSAIDWVLVELRSSTSASSMVIRKAGFVKSDGTIVNTDGSAISFEVREGDYYVVIYQRNHLPVMSASPVTFQ